MIKDVLDIVCSDEQLAKIFSREQVYSLLSPFKDKEINPQLLLVELFLKVQIDYCENFALELVDKILEAFVLIESPPEAFAATSIYWTCPEIASDRSLHSCIVHMKNISPDVQIYVGNKKARLALQRAMEHWGYSSLQEIAI